MKPTLSPLLVTAGEPAGIGPELCIRLATLRDNAGFAVVACPEQLRTLARELAPELSIVSVGLNPLDWPEHGQRTLFVVPLDYPAEIVPGRPDARNAAVMLSSSATFQEQTMMRRESGLSRSCRTTSLI